jgi:type II secretory pathway pseudopilin PulG
MLEVLVVVALVLIISGITAPKILNMVQVQRIQSATRAYASFLQQCRYQAEHDGQWYEVLLDQGDPSVAIAYLDVAGTGVRTTSDPQVQIPAPITVPDPANAAIPAGFGNANLLGATPLNVDTTPATWNRNAQTPGLAFNERGLPCQRQSITGPCTNSTQIAGAGVGLVSAPTAWITYFAEPISGGAFLYAAVTVTPAGRIKAWTYQSTGGGGGTWR